MSRGFPNCQNKTLTISKDIFDFTKVGEKIFSSRRATSQPGAGQQEDVYISDCTVGAGTGKDEEYICKEKSVVD